MFCQDLPPVVGLCDGCVLCAVEDITIVQPIQLCSVNTYCLWTSAMIWTLCCCCCRGYRHRAADDHGGI